MPLDVGALLRKRLLMVVGKGGVGKTTVACALALEASHAGLRTLLVEVDGVGRAAQFFDLPPGPAGQAREVAPRLFLMDVEGAAALAEYLMLIIPVKRVIQAVLHSRIYQYFVAAAPGLKELMTVGKIWYEAERVDETTGQRRWDLLVVDAPATGHSLQYLGMPQAAWEAFPTGLVHREAERVMGLLRDPNRTAVLYVTAAEEMPVNETVELHRRVRDSLKLPAAGLIVNRVHQSDLRPEDVERLGKALHGQCSARQRALFEAVLERAREEVGWIAINQRYLARLAQEVPLPSLTLPYLPVEEFGLREVKILASWMRKAGEKEAVEGLG